MSYEEIWATWTPKESTLVEGLYDMVYASWVINFVRETVPEPLWRPTTIGLIAELLVEGLMLPGEVDYEGIHHPWDCSAGEAIARIALEWLTTEWSHDGVPYPGAIVWLANTEAGNEIARAVLARDGISE